MTKIFLGIGVLVLLVVGFVVYQFYTVRQDGPLNSEAKQKVFTFIEYMEKNDVDSAYNMTSSGFRAEADKQKFSQFVSALRSDGLDKLEAQREVGFSVQANTGKPTTYLYRSEIKNTDGKIGQVYTELVKEQGELKIYNIQINPKNK